MSVNILWRKGDITDNDWGPWLTEVWELDDVINTDAVLMVHFTPHSIPRRLQCWEVSGPQVLTWSVVFVMLATNNTNNTGITMFHCYLLTRAKQ